MGFSDKFILYSVSESNLSKAYRLHFLQYRLNWHIFEKNTDRKKSTKIKIKYLFSELLPFCP